MIDGVTLDQVKAFITAVDEGNFSAASRKLRRAQSVISGLVSSLEAQLGVDLFDRAGRYPRLTAAGMELLGYARATIATVDLMKSRASGMSSGIEPELSVVVDVLFPMDIVARAARDFQAQFPHTSLRLRVEALGGAYEAVIDGRASLGVVGAFFMDHATLAGERVSSVQMTLVVSSDHPLASVPSPIPRTELARHIQLVLSDPSKLSEGKDFLVLSSSTWRLSDLFAKRAFLLSGIGWGSMPLHAVADDIEAERLVQFDVEELSPTALPMLAVYSPGTRLGPAGRWFIDRLRLSEAPE
ncbi:LysR family transcriptional regulator [Sphingobium sp.]|uniref:LysR family transcriptional regulator n=1 Tax=Sphingobium sp. TaxID=1912891 RepID=UPI0028BD24E1|nr:LysR family transcriptional regulator [Sphingobium sp.]